MKPKTVNLLVYRGQTYKQNLYFRSKSGALPLTGATAKAQIRPKLNSAILTAEMECTVDETEGKISLYLSDQKTGSIRPGTYVWDLKVTDSQGFVKYYVGGNFTVSGRVTI